MSERERHILDFHIYGDGRHALICRNCGWAKEWSEKTKRPDVQRALDRHRAQEARP